MENHNFSIKMLALECHWPILRKYAWGLGIILTVSGFMSMLASKKDRPNLQTQGDIKANQLLQKEPPSSPYLTMPNGELLDISTPLTLYSSLFTPHEAFQSSVSSGKLDKLETYECDEGPCEQSLEPFSFDCAISNPKFEQENQEKSTCNELYESPESAPLVDIENKIKANNLIGKIEANMDGLKEKFKGYNDVEASRGNRKLHDVKAEKNAISEILAGIGNFKAKNRVISDGLADANDFEAKTNVACNALGKADTDGCNRKLIQIKLDGFKASLNTISLAFQSKLGTKFDGLGDNFRANCAGFLLDNWAIMRINLILLCCFSIFLIISCYYCSSKKNEVPKDDIHFGPLPFVRFLV